MSKGQQLEERRPRGGHMSATPTIDAASSTATCSVLYKCGEMFGGSPQQKIKAGKLT